MSVLFERWTGLALLSPWLLLLAALLPAAWWWRHRRGRPAVLFAPGRLLGTEDPAAPTRGRRALPRSWRQRLLPVPRVLQVLGLLLLVVALARPAARILLPARSLGLDVMLCLDVSSSMTANDMDRHATRLEVARDAAARFARDRTEDRIGLITFARYPDLVCPPTRDHEALVRLLQGVHTVRSDGPEDATGIGTALARAADVLSHTRHRSRVVILLTDGEENVALVGKKGEIAPAHAAQLLARLGARLYTIAAGTGRPGPSGTWVPLDTRAVRAAAERTGGAFYEARDAEAVRAVYADIDRLEKSPLEEPATAFEDRFLGFVLAGVVLLLLARLLNATVLDVLP